MKNAMIILALCALTAGIFLGCQSVYLTSAKVYIQQNDLENARLQLEEGLKQNPNDAEVHFLLGEIYSRQKQYPEMLREYDATLALNQKHKAEIEKTKEKHFRDLYNSAVENFNNKQSEQAIEKLKYAILINPQDREGWSLLGKSYVRLQQFDTATEAFNKAIALDPNYESLGDRVLLMQMYYNNKNNDEALKLAEVIMRKDPANIDAIRVGAFCNNERAVQESDPVKKLEFQNQAISFFKKVLETQPDNPDMHFNLGELYRAMERYDEAISEYELTFALNVKDTEAISRAAFLYLEMKKNNPRAIELYKKAVEIDPQNGSYWTNLGVAQIQEGTSTNSKELLEEGKKSLEKGKGLSSQNPQ